MKTSFKKAILQGCGYLCAVRFLPFGLPEAQKVENNCFTEKKWKSKSHAGSPERLLTLIILHLAKIWILLSLQ